MSLRVAILLRERLLQRGCVVASGGSVGGRQAILSRLQPFFRVGKLASQRRECLLLLLHGLREVVGFALNLLPQFVQVATSLPADTLIHRGFGLLRRLRTFR